MAQHTDRKRLLTEIMRADAKDGLYKQQTENMTAVEWLVQWGKENPVALQTDYYAAIEQAKAMEKMQIENAYDCALFGHGINGQPCASGGKYYNETYNK